MNQEDPSHAELLEGALEAISDRKSVSEAADALRRLLREDQSLPALAVLYGFSFILVLERDGQLLTRPAFEPRYETAAGDFPPPIAEWDEGVEELLAEAAVHPNASVLARAQLGHTLWRLRPSGANRPLAESALASAIEFGTDPGSEIWERYRILASALDLARQLNDDARRAQALAALLAAADSVIEQSNLVGRGSGTAHDLLRLFLSNGGAAIQAVPLIETAIVEFHDQSRGRTELAMLLESTAPDNETRKAVMSAELDRLISEADEHAGLVKDQLLREAQQLARTRGLSDHIRAIGVRLAQLEVADFDLREHDIHIEIPGEVYRSVMAPLEVGQPVEESLRRLVGLFPPFEPAGESRERSIVELIASPVQISRQGLVTRAPSSADELRDYWERHDEDTLSQFYVGFLDAALQKVVTRDDFLEFVFLLLDGCDLFSAKGKERVRRALAAYIVGEWDVVLDTLPTVEAAIREMARQQGALTVNPAGSSGSMANQQKLLGGLLESLMNSVPSCRRLFRYWEFMLVDQLGWNIRNNYLHGLAEEGTRATAGVLVHIFIQLLVPLR
ncbi:MULTISPECIES: hypothetical protein [unclassified Microbacterium]|uniref:hypothetical protein n=1 Tax=unclassified Microbacterium TaxID=2609290 RepID=UPI00115FE02C|nr:MULTISPECIES: hypothetical protein [unclassified Microbacterium]